MSIQELSLKFKRFFQDTEYVLAALIIVVSVSSFFLGRWSVSDTSLMAGDTPQEITTSSEKSGVFEELRDTSLERVDTLEARAVGVGEYVASKSGTKYHLPWCPGAGQIKEENKIWFKSKEEAERAGYTPAANCKGI